MSTRRSARLKTKPLITFSDLEVDAVTDNDTEFGEENESDSNHEGPSRRKRVKTSARSAGRNAKGVKGKRGKLGALPYVQFLKLCRPLKVSSNLCLDALQRHATGYFI
jgi:hypothetical protein